MCNESESECESESRRAEGGLDADRSVGMREREREGVETQPLRTHLDEVGQCADIVYRYVNNIPRL